MEISFRRFRIRAFTGASSVFVGLQLWELIVSWDNADVLTICNRDDAELGLSETQLEVFDCWRRPDEMVEVSDSSKRLSPAMGTDGKVDLVQDITSDCSVVASLCAVTSREERGHSNARSLITPHMRQR